MPTAMANNVSRVQAALDGAPLEALQQEHGQDVIHEFVRFLALKLEYSDLLLPSSLSPSYPVDQVWHTLMLHPHLYTDMCARLDLPCGKTVIPHEPRPQLEPQTDPDRYMDTYALYDHHFREKPPARFWPPEEGHDDFWALVRNADGHHLSEVVERTSARAQDAMSVNIRTLTGKVLAFRVCMSAAVWHLKALIFKKEGIPIHQQRLIWAGKQLVGCGKLADYGVVHESTIHLVLKLTGC